MGHKGHVTESYKLSGIIRSWEINSDRGKEMKEGNESMYFGSVLQYSDYTENERTAISRQKTRNE